MAQNPFLSSPYDQLNENTSDRYALPGIEPVGKQSKEPVGYLPPDDLRPIFEKAAVKYDVPVNVLMAIGLQESSYRPSIVGDPTKYGRAKGLMQYIDSTAAGMGINPFDPEQAVDAAAKQFRQRLDKGNSIEDAVMAHHGGDDRKQWGPLTNKYRADVLGKAGKIGELIGAHSSKAPQQAQSYIDNLNAEEPGRYRAPTQEEIDAFEKSQKADDENWNKEAAAQQKAIDDQGFLDRAGKAVSGGYDNMVQSLGTAKFVMAGGDSAELAKNLASKFADAQNKKKTTGEQEIETAFQQVTDAKGVWDTTKAGAKAIGTAFSNPKDLAVGIAEQAPNMLPSLAAGAGGAGAGAAIGGGAGAAIGGIGAIPGAIGGAIWGSRAGMVAGTTAVELGGEVEQMVLERLEAGKQAPTEKNIKGLLDDAQFQTEARERGLKKGLTVGIVDQIFLGLGGKVASKAINAPTKLGKAGYAAGAVGLDAVGETTGEAASQLIARGKVNKGEALQEGVYSLGSSMVEPAIGAGMRAAKQAANSMRQQPAAPTPAEQAQAVAAENNIPNIVITGTEDGQQVATVTPAQPSKAAGPLSRAIENAADQPARVTVTAPEGQITGFLQSTSQDSKGNTITRVLGDDGQVYNFTSADNVQIKPEVGPLTSSVEKVAATAPITPEAAPAEESVTQNSVLAENQKVTDATLTNEGTKPAESIDVSGRTDQQVTEANKPGEYQAAADLIAAVDQGGVPLNPAKLRVVAEGLGLDVKKSDAPETTIQRIRDAVSRYRAPEAEVIDVTDRADHQLAYLAKNGKPGWKEAAQAELDKRQQTPAKAPEKTLETMSEPELRERLKYIANQAKSAGGWNKMLMAERRKVEAQINKFAQAIKQETTNDQRDAADLPVRDDQPAVAPVATAQPADQQGAGAGSTETVGAGAAVPGEPVPGAGANVSGADSAADAKPALGKDLAGAKPRYAYGSKQFDLAFDNDIDRAAYIAAQKTPSKRDADYVAFVAHQTGMTEDQVRAHGRAVREAIKQQAKDASPGTLKVPEVARGKKAAPVTQPAQQGNSASRILLLQAEGNKLANELDATGKSAGDDPLGRALSATYNPLHAKDKDAQLHALGYGKQHNRQDIAAEASANLSKLADNLEKEVAADTATPGVPEGSPKYQKIKADLEERRAKKSADAAEIRAVLAGEPVTQPAQPGTTGEGAGASQPTQAAPAKPKTDSKAGPASLGSAKADMDHLFGVDKKREAALARVAKGTAFFGTDAKAKDFITKNGLKDTHTVEQTGKVRFEVKPTQQAMDDSWRNEFERAKKVKDLDAINTLYQKVKISLNGIAQGYGDYAVKQFEELKSDIEQYAERINKEKTTTQEQTNGDQAAETIETQAQEPQAPDTGTGKGVKSEFTYAVKPTEGGFLIESDNGGGVVMSGRPNGPGAMNTVPPRVFKTEAAAREYMQKKGMTEAQAEAKPVAPKAGDILFDKDGTDYRIESERIGEVTLTKNRNKLSERKVKMSSQEFERLLQEDNEYRSAVRKASEGAVAIEFGPAAMGKKASVAPGTRTNGETERKAADRLEKLYDQMSVITERNSREGNAKAAVRTIVEELRKPRTVTSVEAILEKASTDLTRKYGAFASVIDEVVDSLKGQNDELDAEMRSYERKAEAAPEQDAIQQQFANNKIFTADKVEAARARLRSKLTQLNSGIDPEVLVDGMTIAGAYIESGVRKFSDYAKAMTDDLGDTIKPYLLSFYEAARNYPGVDKTGMSTVDEASAEHAALVNGMSETAKEEVKEAVGTVAKKPAKLRKTGSKSDVKLTQDFGVSHIDGYGDAERETGNSTKDAFLKDAKNYLNAVAGILTEQGYMPHKDGKGRDMKPVSVNESGMAGSGDVSLTMYRPDGGGIYVTIGDTTLRGIAPTTKSGIAIMFRAASEDNKLGTRSTNRWAPVDLSAADMAIMLDKEAKAGKIEKPQSGAILNTQGVKNADTTTAAGSAGNRALEGAPAAEVRGAQEGRNAEQRGAEGGRTDAGTAGNADRAGDTGGSRMGDGTRDVSVPARGRGGKRGSAGQRRVQAELGIEQADARPVTEQRDAEVAAARQEQKAAGDYRITDLTRLGEGGQKTKYKNNVAAIRLLNDLQQTGRLATPDEQDVLARYVGWGGIAQAFDPDNKEWSAEYAELKSVLTDEEWEASKESTQYAHYTSQEIIEGMWDAARHMGFTGGNILEPGSGVGNFIGLMPEDLRSASRFTAVERERIAGGIAKQLYPNQNVQQQDFRKFNAQDGYYDLVAGNPPFSSTTLTDLSGRKHLSGLSIHNYFFAKSIDMLGEGKILMQVVSNSFLDAKGDKARRYIGERTEFLGAIRLPNKAFAKNANTEVTTDIVFLKKRPESEWGSKAAKDDMQRWQGLGSVPDPLGGDPIPLNQYFVDHPEMMLGRMERAGSMYGPGQPALIAREGQDTKALMKQAILRLPKDVYVATTKITNEAMQTAEVVALDNAATVDVGGHYVKDGSVFVRMADVAGEGRAMQLTATTKISEKRELGANGLDRIKQLAEMRVTVRGLIAAEIKDADNIEALRAKLNEQYDAYVKKNGYINGRGTVQLFGDDPDFPLLASLENNYDPGIGAAAAKNQGIKPVPASAKKATIFSQRVIEKHEEVTSADTPEDALMVSIAERGQIDAGYIGQLLGKDGTEVLEGLTKGDNPALFVDPATNGYVLADEYLSGNVRKKLSQAKAAGMYGNVAALEKVIPEDIPSHEISGKIGAPWVSTDVYQDFATEIMGEGTKARVVYVPAMSSYVANFEAGSEVANKNTFGTARMGADEIYAALLNSKEIRVGHYEEDPATRSRRFVLEKDATDEANDKAREIKDKFNDWLFSDADRAEKMQRAYNDAVNNYVTREFDGSMLKFPGKVPDVIIKLRRHQRNAVARIIQDGRALLDHVVGAGKTFTVIAAAMELKRTGLAKKPMIVVPNHLVKQWAADFYRLYPGANILTATKTDFSKANRRKFLAKIATGNWDAVIIAHSSYGFIKPDAEFEARFNKERIDEIVDAIKALKDEKDQTSKRTVKQLAKMQENLENKLASLRDRPMDDLLDFGQLGSDQLFVDEAHLFKNLMFVTKMQNVRGLGQPKGSQRAYDMFIKTHQIYEKNGNGRGVVFATGTPVSNSLAEMYHMLRYLAPETLKDSGQFTFDAWAKTFADVEQVWMQSMSGDGYKSSNRMSRFVNTPELLRVYDQVADTVTIDDIKQAFSEENNGAEFPIPKQKGGRRTPVSIPRSQAQTEYMDEIAKRAKALEQRKGKPQKGDDNMLSIMGDARKSAMDIRMVRFDITERDQNGRIAIAANNIFDRYQKYNDVRGTQLVFSDMGTPKKHAEKELKEYNELMAEVAPLSDDKVLAMAELGDESAQDQIEKAEEAQRKVEAKGQDWLDAIQAAMRGFSIYDDLKDALMEKGIPENEIAFIHDYNTDDQKAALFRAVNDGKVRVLLGSTEKMGAGTNVQERAVALHHLDVPWKPSDIEQREGRVIRQGNRLLNEVPNFEVEVMAYATQDTLDLFMWQTQEKKLSMIGQLRTGNVGREVDNAFEEMQMSAGEMQAAATSNPYLLEEIQLKDKVKKLERQKRSFEGQKNDLINRVRRAEKEVESIPPQIKDAQTVETAARKLVSHKDAHFNGLTATVNGETITGSDAIRQAIRNAVEASPMVTKDGKEARSVSIEFNGKEYTSESGVAEAANKALGDAAKITYTLPNGTTVYRGADVVAGLIDPIADLIETDGEAKLGKMGAFDVTAYGAGEGRFDVMVTLNGTDVGDFQIRTELKEPGALSARIRSIPTEVTRIIQSSIGLPAFLKSKLEKAKRTLADIEGKQDAGVWSGEDELKKARESYRAILKKLSETAEEQPEDDGAKFSVAAMRDETELEAIFADLEKRGLARNRAERMLNSDPDQAIIRYVDQNFFDILEELEDSKKVTIRC